jgi:hypothetical protein
MKQAPWILLTVALVIVMLQQMCNKADLHAQEQKFSQLEKKFVDTLESYHRYQQSADAALDNATAIAIQANEQSAQSQAALDRERRKVLHLLVMLDSAERETPDSTWVQVSPRYKEACDSLRKVNLTLNYRIMQYEQGNQVHIDALGYEVHLRDSLLERERDFNSQFRRQLADCITAAKDQEKTGRPRTQLYGGIAMWGNRGSLLGGGEINLAVKTPRDAIYEVKGAYLLNTWWAGIGTKFNLFK